MTGPAAPQAGWADARVSGRPGTSGFSFAAPKVMVLAGQMFPPLFSARLEKSDFLPRKSIRARATICCLSYHTKMSHSQKQ